MNQEAVFVVWSKKYGLRFNCLLSRMILEHNALARFTQSFSCT